MANRGLPQALGALAALLVLGAWIFPLTYLPGSDGYYLPDQAVGLLGPGALRIKNHDLTPYLLAALVRLGLTPETGVKLILFGAAAAWFYLGRKTENALFYWLAPAFVFHLIQFPKLTFSLLLAAQALAALGRWVPWLWVSASALFHPVGLGAWLAAKSRGWKTWAPWAAMALLTGALVLYAHFIRGQDFSAAPVGFKLLTNPHYPWLLRLCLGGWVLGIFFGGVEAWPLLGLLAPGTAGELFGAPERWALALALLSPWIAPKGKGKPAAWAALLAPLLVGGILPQLPGYDYRTLDGAIRLSKGLGMRMLVVDRTGKFYFTAKTGLDGYFFEPEDGWDKESIWRVVRQVSPGEIFPYMEGACAPGAGGWFALGPDTLLMREDCWEGIRAKIRQEENGGLYERAWDDAINPCRKRPLFLEGRNR